MGKKIHQLKLGLFTIGLEAYWKQFPGLRKKIDAFMAVVEDRLQVPGHEVVNMGLIDTPEKAMEAGHDFRKADIDILFLYVPTYALSSYVLPVIQRTKVPVVILNLAPDKAIDYDTFNAMSDRSRMTEEWLSFCSACPVPEIANVLKRAGIQFHEVSGMLQGDESCWKEINEWIEAAHVKNVMSHNRLGTMGHYYSGMLDIYTDLTLQLTTFGGHIEMIEVDELSAERQTISEQNIEERCSHFQEVFDIDTDCDIAQLKESARTSLAMDALVERYSLGSLAYYYKGAPGSENEKSIASIILGNSLLTARGIPVAGEYEIKNAQAMKIMDAFGAGGSFTEYYAMDYADDVVLMGHDGPGHIKIAQGKIKVRPLKIYHGKVSSGLSVEMAVKYGPVTCLSVIEHNGKLCLLVAEGESVTGPILKIGNTNSRYRFSIGAKAFVKQWNSHGPAHHCAVGIGHLSDKIEKLGTLLGIETIKVC